MPIFQPIYRVHLSLALLSAAIIAFQLALMQILSIVQWHHFAYMVISVALLGFGAAGTFLSLLGQRLVIHIKTLLPLLLLATAIIMALLVEGMQLPFVRFDSYLLFADWSHLGRLLLLYLLFFLPFFLGALAIGLIFLVEVENIGRIYFANLLGSGGGGLLALWLIHYFFPQQLPACIAVLPLLAALLLFPRTGRGLVIGMTVAALAAIVWKGVQPPRLVLSQYKDISKALLLPDAVVGMEKSSPYGLTQTLSSPVLRYAPGLSLMAAQTASVRLAAFVNGDWFGVVTDYRTADTTMILDYTTMALPYAVRKRAKVLVLRSGTGIDVAHALSEGAEKITAVEPNGVILQALKKELAGASDSLFSHPRVEARNKEPRTFLLSDRQHYDLIVLPMVGTFGGSAGLHALQEQFILTKEAFTEMWHRLTPTGALCISSWMDYPFRNPLKVQATLVEVLQELGIKNPAHHLTAVRSWGTITFMLTRSPLGPEEVHRIRSFCEAMEFDPVLLPGLQPGERTWYNQLSDSSYFGYVDTLVNGNRASFYQDYDFNIQPATDSRPYFSQFIKWNSLKRVAGFFGNRSLPFFEIGYLLVVVTFLQIVVLSFILVVLPLFRMGWKGRGQGRVLLYFTGIGLGYMFVEIIFIQRFMLYLGNPVYAASAVITTLLICSGIGSYTSAYFGQRKHRMIGVLGAIVAMLLLYAFLLTPVLLQTIHLATPLKLLLVFLLISPLAFLLGIPFPVGILQVSKKGSDIVPWAWGVNGYVSVISTALATLVAVELGSVWVLLLAALAYSLPLLVQARWR